MTKTNKIKTTFVLVIICGFFMDYILKTDLFSLAAIISVMILALIFRKKYGIDLLASHNSKFSYFIVTLIIILVLLILFMLFGLLS